ncbi:MAG TPA: type VI secretion system-associated protein TagF [Polyangiaceae bacterium]
MTTLRISRVAALGKIRSEREFLRSPTSAALHAFDSWLVENMDWAAGHCGDQWSRSFANGALHAFVFRVRLDAGKDAVLAGTIAPSADELGRQFPLAVVAELESPATLAPSPELLPVLLEQLWDQSAEIVFESSDRGIHPASRLSHIEHVLTPDLESARSAYDEWLHKCTAPELAALCAESSAHFLESLAVLADAIRPHRASERPNTPLSFHLPLGHGGGAVACFWLDLLRRGMAWTRTVPSFFWSADHDDAHVLLHLGEPPKQTLAELWGARGKSDAFCDLATPHARERPDLSLPPELASALSAPDTTLHQLLQILG